MTVPVYYRRLQDGDTVRQFKLRLSPGAFQRRMAWIQRILNKRHLSLSDQLRNFGGGVVERVLVPDLSDAAVILRWNADRARNILLRR